MKLGDRIKKSVEEKNYKDIGNIVNFLWLKGLNHEQTFKVFNDLTGISLPEFDELLYQIDEL